MKRGGVFEEKILFLNFNLLLKQIGLLCVPFPKMFKDLKHKSFSFIFVNFKSLKIENNKISKYLHSFMFGNIDIYGRINKQTNNVTLKVQCSLARISELQFRITFWNRISLALSVSVSLSLSVCLSVRLSLSLPLSLSVCLSSKKQKIPNN